MSTGSFLAEGLAPFRRLLSLSTEANGLLGAECEEEDGISDWGIEAHESRSVSSHTLVTERTQGSVSFGGDTPLVGNGLLWGLSPEKTRQPVRHWSVSDLCLQLGKRALGIELDFKEFLEEFRYVLVTSQLLDETIFVSKFYNNKRSSQFQLKSNGATRTKYGKVIRLGSQYQVTPIVGNFTVIQTVLRLHKMRNISQRTHHELELALKKALITLHSQTRSRAMVHQLIQKSSLSKLRVLIKTFQEFDMLVQRLLGKYKETELYAGLTQSEATTDVSSTSVFEQVNSVTILLTQGILKSLHVVLPIINGKDFENYCDIYNVDITKLALMLDETPSGKPVDGLVQRVKALQFIRRVFICTLLAINSLSTSSEFSKRLFNLLQIQPRQLSTLDKWQIVSSTLSHNEGLVSTLVEAMNDFVKLYNVKFGTTRLELPLKAISHDPTLELSRKVKELQLEIISFDKESSSEDQFVKYRALQEQLDSLVKQYQIGLTAMEATLNRRPFRLQTQRVTSLTRKRFSLPTGQHSPFSPSPTGIRSLSSSPTTGRRSSSGLCVPLVTVLEEVNVKPRDLDAMLSTDDSVVITSDNDKSFETMDEDMLKLQLEKNFSRITSTSTVMSPDNQYFTENSINKNDAKVDEQMGSSLMDEMKMAMLQRDHTG